MGDVHQGVGASGPWRVPVEPGLGKPASHLITEPVEQPRPSVLVELPVQSLAVGQRRALEALQLCELGGTLG
jgi:hypothetical protein